MLVLKYILTILITALIAGCVKEETPPPVKIKEDPVWKDMRKDMVALLLRFGIKDQAVLDAMSAVQRHKYIPKEHLVASMAYGNHPCPIGHGQTISQPYIVAYMTEQMKIKKGDRILEIGTGSGYQAAVLAEMGADVFTIEIIPELAKHAEETLKAEGYDDVRTLLGDGYKGWPDEAPFDVIIVTCAPQKVPDALVKQLADNGRMILPTGEYSQHLYILEKRKGKVERKKDLAVRFVPMVHD